MFNIDRYLKRFSKNLYSLEEDKKRIVEIINNKTSLNIKVSEIEIKDYKVFVKTTPVGKNQLFINKNKIMDEISSSINTKIVDIK